jgi:glycosyltransferase involved in cell wall biosynthesis
MHICILISTPFPPEEGIGNYVYGLSTKLIENGHKVTIITRGRWNKTQREVIDSIEVIKVRFIPLYPLYIHMHGIFVNKTFRSLESQIDIVHVHMPLSPFIKTSLPIITTIHTPMLIDSRSIEVNDLRSKIERFMGRFVSYPIELKMLKRADLITTVSSSVVHELKDYDVNPEEVILIGNGVDEKAFIPIINKNNDKYILFVGRLSYRKGLFDLIECGKHVCEKYPDVSFIILGKGLLFNKLKKEVEENELKQRFRFLGFVDREKLIQIYQNATIYVMPSHYEGLPTVLLEAMSCGLPVVATAVSGNVDVISSGQNGILIPPKSPKDMARAISMLLDDDKMRKELGKNARKTIEERYTWDIVAKNFLKVYGSCRGVIHGQRKHVYTNNLYEN